MKSKFQYPQSFTGTQPHSLSYVLLRTAFMLHQSCVVADSQPNGQESLKYLENKFVDP